MRAHYLPLVLLSIAGVLGAEPKRDPYGDPLPEGAIARLGSLRLRNDEHIFTAAFTADGKTLAVLGNNSISYWNPVTGKLARRVEFKKAAFPVQLRRLGTDGKTLIEVRTDNRNILHVLDAFSGAERGTVNYAQCGLLRYQDISRDGKIIATVHQGSIALWDVPSSKLLHKFKGPATLPPIVESVIALIPDGKQLVLPHPDGSLHLVDVATGKELRALEMPPARQGRPPSLRIQRLAVSPDGRYLAFGSWDTPFTVCDLTTGKRLFEPASLQGYPFRGVTFAPNGRILALGEETGIRLYAVPSGKEIRKLPLTPGTFNQLHFSPDGRTLAAVGALSIKLWDMTAERWLHPFVGHDKVINSIVFFPDGERLISADYNEMKIWNIASGQILSQRANTPFASLAVDRGGESVRFAGFSSAYLWDPRTGRDEVRKCVADLGGVFSALAVSPDGRSLAVRRYDSSLVRQKRVFTHQLLLFDVKTNKYKELPGLPPTIDVSQALFTPDSRRLAAYSYDNATRLWDRDTGKLVYELERKDPPALPTLRPLAFAADGRSLLTWSGGSVRICELASCTDRLKIPADPNSLNALAYGPDARFVACGHRDGRILVYSAVSGKQLAQWQGKQGAVHALAFRRDGRLLASGGVNGTILIWEVPPEERLPVVLKAEEADSLWQALGDIDAVAANRALAGLTAAPAQALPLFRERLEPLAKQLDRKQYADLIAALDDDSFKVRERATRELERAGGDAADALRQALLNSPSVEAKRRIEELLARLEKGGYSQRLRFVRAIEVLERIGSPQAKDVLRSLAGQALPPDLREEVQASLRRLGDKP